MRIAKAGRNKSKVARDVPRAEYGQYLRELDSVATPKPLQNGHYTEALFAFRIAIARTGYGQSRSDESN